MKTFVCVCGHRLHFENTRCLSCQRELGFDPERLQLIALDEPSNGVWRAADESVGEYRQCQNYYEAKVCNWLLPAHEQHAYCRACRLNHLIPDLTKSENHVLWLRIERAKRRLLYTLYRLHLPVQGPDEDAERGLRFQFLSAPYHGEFSDAVNEQHVMTGHHQGLITINIAEADPSQREAMREKMGELYRTLLGHFRHEIGHYYWGRFTQEAEWLEPCRAVFGDEREDYAQALARYYRDGAPADWSTDYISAYAASHPWEDFAETFSHYLHMVDTLDTAYDFGFAIGGRLLQPPANLLPGHQYTGDPRLAGYSFDTLLQDWVNLTVVMNALNRSMGLRDAYPFAITARVSEKLRFIHHMIVEHATPGSTV